MSSVKIKPCPHGGKPEWKSWEWFGFEYIYLQCSRQRCNNADFECASDDFRVSDADAAIHDWNRKMEKKEKEKKQGGIK